MSPSQVSWKQRLASSIILVAGLFWIVFGLAELAAGTDAAAGVIGALALGGIILLTLIVAYRRPALGGALLVMEGLPPLVSAAVWSRSPVVFVILGLPSVVSGFLFLIHWRDSKHSGHTYLE